MKYSKAAKEDYSKIIGQIDSLKTNIAQLISVNNQDTSRTVRISQPKKQKSPCINKRMKTSQADQKKVYKKKNNSQSNKQNKKTQNDQTPYTIKLWEKLIQVQKSNQQIKSSHLILQQMLKIQRQKRIKLQKQLKECTKQKNTIGIQKDYEQNRSQSIKIFTPQRLIKNEVPKRRQSKTRDEGDIQSFLLGDCDDFGNPSPKRRKQSQTQIIELIQQIARPGHIDRRNQMKSRLLDAVKRFIRK